MGRLLRLGGGVARLELWLTVFGKVVGGVGGEGRQGKRTVEETVGKAKIRAMREEKIMQTEVKFDGSFAELLVELGEGESVQAEPGAMVAQQGVRMETGFGGGLLGGLKRSLGGESFFMNTFTGETGGGWVRLAAGTPGSKRFKLLKKKVGEKNC